MKLAGIIAELNPLHNGHAYLLAQARSAAPAVAVAMSGYFVQRGEPALFSPFARAGAALNAGADLVLSLPTDFSLAPAERFAAAGVQALARLGVTDLVFGCESGEAADFFRAAGQVRRAEASARFSELLGEGMGYPAARAGAVEELFGKQAAAFLSTPNNQLGVCYAAAVKKFAPSMALCPVLRRGAGHDESKTASGYAGASLLRARMERGDFAFCAPYLPKKTPWSALPRCPHDGLEAVLLAFLRRAEPERLSHIAQAGGEGLLRRILHSGKQARSLDELLALCACKRYTNARIRRVLYCALLGVCEKEQAGAPEYLRLLALDKTGEDILSAMPKSGIPITASPAKYANLSQVRLDCLAADLWGVGASPRQPAGAWLRGKLLRGEKDEF